MTDLPLLLFGFWLGLRHTLDVDHLVAMSTIVSGSRSLRRSALCGVLWGVGHTVPVLAAGLLVIGIGWRPRSSDQPILEAFVGLMLVGLGLRVLWRLRRGAAQLHLHRHQHGMRFHSHPHIHFGDEHAPVQSHHEIAPMRAPFLVGIVHGLAGSAAFALLYAQTRGAGLSFLAVFGSGTILGMGAMSSLLAVPFFPTAPRLERLQIWARGLAGAVSVAFGSYVLFEASWSWAIR